MKTILDRYMDVLHCIMPTSITIGGDAGLVWSITSIISSGNWFYGIQANMMAEAKPSSR